MQKNISFSKKVRDELAKKYTRSRSCQKAELLACSVIGSKFDFTQAKKKFNITEEDLYGINIGELTEKLPEKRAFLRGAFISAGSMSDPEKGYHLEMTCESEENALLLQEMLKSFDIKSHIIKRNNKWVVYIKDGDGIADFLRCVEAPASLMEYENIRILRETRAAVNRHVNFETANINKSVRAANRQTMDIELIDHTVGLENLDDNLRKVCEARLENPEMGLEELGKTLTPPLGKSGVNHRFRKIGELAEKIRRNEIG